MQHPFIPQTFHALSILPIKKKSNQFTIYKLVAVALALLLLKFSALASGIQLPVAASVTISGTVMHEKGQPIENAKVFVDNTLMATTNKEGKYQFDLELDNIPRSYALTMTAEGMVTVARSYHPAMLATTFDVVMKVFEDDCCKDRFKLDPIDFQFLQKKSAFIKFDEEMKQLLSAMAVQLRNRPEISIDIIAHSGVAQLDLSRQEKLKNYLVDHEAISEERIRFVTEISTNPEMRDVVTVKRGTQR